MLLLFLYNKILYWKRKKHAELRWWFHMHSLHGTYCKNKRWGDSGMCDLLFLLMYNKILYWKKKKIISLWWCVSEQWLLVKLTYTYHSLSGIGSYHYSWSNSFMHLMLSKMNLDSLRSLQPYQLKYRYSSGIIYMQYKWVTNEQQNFCCNKISAPAMPTILVKHYYFWK